MKWCRFLALFDGFWLHSTVSGSIQRFPASLNGFSQCEKVSVSGSIQRFLVLFCGFWFYSTVSGSIQRFLALLSGFLQYEKVSVSGSIQRFLALFDGFSSREKGVGFWLY